MFIFIVSLISVIYRIFIILLLVVLLILYFCGGGRPDWYVYSMRRWRIWNYFISYFPIKLIKTADIPPNKVNKSNKKIVNILFLIKLVNPVNLEQFGTIWNNLGAKSKSISRSNNVLNIVLFQNYIFCSHPHGVLCFGIFGAMGTEGAGK